MLSSPYQPGNSHTLLGMHGKVKSCMMRSPILEDIDISEAAKALWEAPFAVLAHDKFENEDPVFTYANKASLAFCAPSRHLEPLIQWM